MKFTLMIIAILVLSVSANYDSSNGYDRHSDYGHPNYHRHQRHHRRLINLPLSSSQQNSYGDQNQNTVSSDSYSASVPNIQEPRQNSNAPTIEESGQIRHSISVLSNPTNDMDESKSRGNNQPGPVMQEPSSDEDSSE